MAVATLINGSSERAISPMDRGLAYGDGLFESIRFVGAKAPLWQRHMRRLDESCRRLRMPAPDPGQLWEEASAVRRDLPHAVVRITLTRGVGERGYAPPARPSMTRIVAAFAAPVVPSENYADGVCVRLCELRMAAQPALAGIKHLNRLEQVLARAEWNEPAVAEGLLCDSDDRVVCATMANVFAVIDGALLTPSVDRCGVAGVARAEVLQAFPQAQIGDISLDALRMAEEIFLTSSVRGIVPVSLLGDRVYAPGTITRKVQQHWHTLGFSMEQAG
ncbi:4-amino-4-deoxychorismate lyase [Rhodanobacter sp. ANJX3]|uniref:aminodeoxychorismate lyase n=1 Tax=unclassified Rhodanobacter TaxID=2621553 RepID=UPI0015C78650|nr:MULTISPECIES: aminodeoxychorismate lyase [unclassified Rhodanobacter]MBB5357858.1 4-amino-4-deoxychorismate lyase [Rhodanobacter sp. ANJX3]